MTDWATRFLFLAQDEGAAQGASWLRIIQAGGLVGYLIIGLSVVMLTMIVLHVIQIRRSALVPPDQLDVLDGLLARGDLNAALDYCMEPEHDSYLTRIMGAGLTRFQRSAFGAFEIKNAIEEAGEEQTARLYRSTDVLSVIGSVGPLMGLLGTVLGMVGAFDTLSRGATPDHSQLAGNLSLALVTTLLGLCVAIPSMVLFSYFRNRIDALAAEAAREIERLLIHLESGPAAGTGPAGVARPAMPRPMAGGTGLGGPAPMTPGGAAAMRPSASGPAVPERRA